jgi:peptide/nickel transport system permease protein
MARYIARRLLQIPLLLIGATLLTFALTRLVSGGPLDNLRQQIPGITDQDLARIERSLGLDQPAHKQYLSWMGHVVQGDFGVSLSNRRPVRGEIMDRLPNSLVLVGSAMVLSLVIAIPAGVLAAVRRNSFFDQVTNAVASLGSALPTFWIGLLLILAFSVQATEWGLPALPSSGMRSVVGGGGIGDRIEHLVLPVATLSIFQVSSWLRYVRAQMLEVLGQDYVRTARSKGLRERTVLARHAFRNSLLPLVTLIGLSLPQLIAGAAVVETIFSWPGLGALSVQSATDKDYTTIIGLTVFVSAATLISNLLTDLAYAVVDPRIRYQ